MDGAAALDSADYYIVTCQSCGSTVHLPGAQCDCALRDATQVALQWETSAGQRAQLRCAFSRSFYEMSWAAAMPGDSSVARGECAGPAAELEEALARILLALVPADPESIESDLATGWDVHTSTRVMRLLTEA
jgi:hypothetical protein